MDPLEPYASDETVNGDSVEFTQSELLENLANISVHQSSQMTDLVETHLGLRSSLGKATDSLLHEIAEMHKALARMNQHLIKENLEQKSRIKELKALVRNLKESNAQ